MEISNNIPEFSSEDICGNNGGEPYFSGRNLDLPEWIRMRISQINEESSEAQRELKDMMVENFIRTSLYVDSWNYVLNSYIYQEIITLIEIALWESRFTLEDIDFPDYVLRDIFINALMRFSQESPQWYREFYEDWDFIVYFWGIEIDINQLLPDPLEEIMRPVMRPENFVDHIYVSLEWDQWFQQESNNGMTLNDALDIYWFNEYVRQWFAILFGRELSPSELENIKLLIQFTTAVESQYGYNIVRDIPELPSWYFQYQTRDGYALKEIYDFSTQTFQAAWAWQESDREVYDVSGNDRRWVRRVRWDSSYDMALRSLPEEIRGNNPRFLNDYENIWNPENQNFMALNSWEQILLFISDCLSAPWGENYFNRILSWDREAIVDMYVSTHNTNENNGTQRNSEIYAVISDRAREVLQISVSEDREL